MSYLMKNARKYLLILEFLLTITNKFLIDTHGSSLSKLVIIIYYDDQDKSSKISFYDQWCNSWSSPTFSFKWLVKDVYILCRSIMTILSWLVLLEWHRTTNTLSHIKNINQQLMMIMMMIMHTYIYRIVRLPSCSVICYV